MVIANDWPVEGEIVDQWVIQDFSSADAISGPHACAILLIDPTASVLEDGSYFVPRGDEGWQFGPGFNVTSGFGCRAGLGFPGIPLFNGPFSDFAELPPLIADAGPDISPECSSSDGALVPLDGSDSTAPPEATYTWTEPITGQETTGVAAEMQLPLGTYDVTLEVTVDDRSSTDSLSVTVRDTQPPVISAQMNPAGDNGHNFEIVAQATDVCDPYPMVSASVGAEVDDGNTITIARPEEDGLVRFMSSMVELAVEAVDASGNRSIATATP